MTEFGNENAEDLERKARSEWNDRERIALLKSEALIAQWDRVVAARAAHIAAGKTHQEDRARFTQMLAETLNVKLGMHVTQTKAKSWRDKTPVSQTFEVTEFKLNLFYPDKLDLFGRLIRKDGSPGVDVRSIGLWGSKKDGESV
jgi:hypothetical protein